MIPYHVKALVSRLHVIGHKTTTIAELNGSHDLCLEQRRLLDSRDTDWTAAFAHLDVIKRQGLDTLGTWSSLVTEYIVA